MQIKDRNTRNEIIRQIKEAGQELIDRAESMISPDTELISDFNLDIYFDINDNGPARICWSVDVINKNVMNRLMSEDN